ncbi:MAG: hypothetical protein SVV80_08240 [Planctomycetota bacterium]|nr:hypothetical protein [Planctomycetota bacterium]
MSNTDKQTVKNGDGRASTGQFAKGNPGGPGRPKGSPNKVNALLKKDILAAYKEKGGIEWLRGLYERLFVQLLEKIIPREIAADVSISGGLTYEQIIDRLNESKAA